MTDGPNPSAAALPPLPAAFAATRDSLHLIAARVLGAARYGAVGRLGLVVVPGGFATPEFDGRRLLVVDGQLSDGHRRRPLTTLDDACAFAGVDPAAPTHPVLALPADPAAPLAVDPDAARALGTWFNVTADLLTALVADAGDDDDPSPMQLWPEHFDLALESGPAGARANYGGSPGDAAIAEPYLYVGPHDRRAGSFWNTDFGAALRYSAITGGQDPGAFLRRGRDLLRHS